MRILVLTNRVPYPLKDGGSVAVMQMLNSLINCGFEVKLLSLNTNKHFSDTNLLPEIFKTLQLETVSINTDVNIKDALRNMFSDKSYNAIRFYSDEFKDLLIRVLTNNHYDLVLFESIYTAMYIDFVRKYSKAKCVLRAHNIEFEIWEKSAQEESFIKRQYIEFLAKRLKNYEVEHWKKFDAIIPISVIDEITIKSYTNQNIHYLSLPTAIDISVLSGDNSEADILNVFHLGSMDWMPNQQAMEWFLKNVWQLIEKSTQASFHMAGRNMPEEFFEFRSERVKIYGDVDDAFQFMHDKQIMVVPLFAGSGVRIKIIEGMAAGKTIVTTSLGVQGIDAFDKEHVLIANNAKAFAEAVIWCVKNERKCKEIGRNARKLIESKYSSTSFELKIKTFLLKLTSQ